jgi:hypothetical protein
MAKIETIRVHSFAKFQAVLMAPVGLLAGILYSFGGAIYEVLSPQLQLNPGSALAFLALIGMPITFAAFGFIVGLVEAVLYNPFARWLGGLEMDFVQSA